MIEFIKAIVFGLVEGITEWLPVSSTGHMIILQELMPLNVSDAFWNMFLVVIQLGAILAVIVLYFPIIWPFAKGSNGTGVTIKRETLSLWGKIIVACIPAGIVGVLFDDQLEELFFNPTSVAIALIVFGIAFIVVETLHRGKRPKTRKLEDLSYTEAILIGLFQVLAAVFPGTSRSGATIIGGLIIGVSRKVAAEFTFILAIPVMLGASLLKLMKFGFGFSGMEIGILLVGMIVAFIVSIVVIKFLLNYIRRHDFKVFGYYRIILGIIVLLFFAIRG